MPVLRRYLWLLLLVILVPAGVQVAIWTADAIEQRRTAPAVKAARAFLAAFGHGDCERALALLSAASRRAVEADMAAQRPVRDVSGPRACWTPAMRAFHGLRGKSARLAFQADGAATVSLDHYEADPKSFLIPGFWPTRFIVTPAQMRLVAEAGAWRVVVP